MILLHFKNCLGNGIDVTLTYNPVFDGPLESYMNRSDVTIEYVTNKNENNDGEDTNSVNGTTVPEGFRDDEAEER